MESSNSIIHYTAASAFLQILKYDLDTLLKSINDPNHDIYTQRTMLRDGIKTISERCEETIKILESGK